MKSIMFTSLLTLLLSTSLQASAHNDSISDMGDMLGRAPQNCVVFSAEGRTLNEEGEDSLFNEIELYMADNGNNDSAPVHIYMGEENLNNESSFVKFAISLQALVNLPVKDLTLKVDPFTNSNLRYIVWLSFDTNVKSFALEGFQKLEALGDRILAESNLISFSIKECYKLEYIGNAFLGSNRLTSFNTEGFESVKSIGWSFLAGNSSLRSVDLRGFKNVTSVGDGFLTGCPIETVIVANEAQKEFFKEHVLQHNPGAQFIIR